MTDAIDARDAQLVAQAAQWEATRYVPSRTPIDQRDQRTSCVTDEKTGRCKFCGRGPESRLLGYSREPIEAVKRAADPRFMWEGVGGNDVLADPGDGYHPQKSISTLVPSDDPTPTLGRSTDGHESLNRGL